jgi:hypothetical protein
MHYVGGKNTGRANAMFPDCGFRRFARFFQWMLIKQDGGLSVSCAVIAEYFNVTERTARSWRSDYFAARGVTPWNRRGWDGFGRKRG